MNRPDASSLESLLRNATPIGGTGFSAGEVATLKKYYDLILKWNPRLHLTTITGPQEFFDRHIVESVHAARRILPTASSLWDLGTGAGIPGLVIAILRPYLPVALVESNRKKAIFLDEAVVELGLENVQVFAQRFEKLEPPAVKSCVTSRAIEEMEKLIPEIMRFGTNSEQFLLFGGEMLGKSIEREVRDGCRVDGILIPGSDRRFLYNVSCST